MSQDSQEDLLRVRSFFLFEFNCSSCGDAGIFVRRNIFEGISRYCPNCGKFWHPAFSDEDRFGKWHGMMLLTLQKRLDEKGPHSFHLGFGDFKPEDQI